MDDDLKVEHEHIPPAIEREGSFLWQFLSLDSRCQALGSVSTAIISYSQYFSSFKEQKIYRQHTRDFE